MDLEETLDSLIADLLTGISFELTNRVRPWKFLCSTEARKRTKRYITITVFTFESSKLLEYWVESCNMKFVKSRRVEKNKSNPEFNLSKKIRQIKQESKIANRVISRIFLSKFIFCNVTLLTPFNWTNFLTESILNFWLVYSFIDSCWFDEFYFTTFNSEFWQIFWHNLANFFVVIWRIAKIEMVKMWLCEK